MRRLERVRLREGMTKGELARLLSVRPSHVTEWKKGRNLPNAEAALTMMELIKTKPKK
jgi:DNA-binding transcriptional regulator YiaG